MHLFPMDTTFGVDCKMCASMRSSRSSWSNAIPFLQSVVPLAVLSLTFRTISNTYFHSSGVNSSDPIRSSGQPESTIHLLAVSFTSAIAAIWISGWIALTILLLYPITGSFSFGILSLSMSTHSWSVIALK